MIYSIKTKGGINLIKTYSVHYNPNLDFEKDVQKQIDVEEVGECPLCHTATSPTFINGYLIGSKENQIPLTAFVILYCPKCKQLYTAKYHFINGLDVSVLVDIYPQHLSYIEFSDNITELSPEFVNIYTQSIEAEHNTSTKGLAGLGYRKSLEFLIKDYLIKLKHKDKDTIIKLELGQCISQLDEDLQDIAKASTWLGNDEVHYFRKNPDYDINDLKDFISCLVADIEREYVRIKAKKLTHSK